MSARVSTARSVNEVEAPKPPAHRRRRLGLLVPAALVALAAAFAGGVVLGSAVLDRPATSASTAVVVTAPHHVVWRLLTDFDGYGRWNPFITRARGDARSGENLWLRLALGATPDEFDCALADVKQGRKVRWRCRKHDVPGLLDRDHTFRVVPLGPERVRVVYEGRWEGVLVPFTDLGDWKQGYAQMARALKQHAEATT